MQPKEIFRLALRILGLFFLYGGLYALPRTIRLILEAFPQIFNPHLPPAAVGSLLWNVLMDIVMLAWVLWVAHWLIRGAP
jgi:hypothetical protein